jgi:hypothetical protein
MISRSHRTVSAIAFAVLWTAWMLWWSFPDRGIAHTVIFAVVGSIVGLLWYWLMGWFSARRSRGAD